MGAGAVLESILPPRSPNPALEDALAFQEDQFVLAQDFWAAIAVFEAEVKSSSRSGQKKPLEDADDGAGEK